MRKKKKKKERKEGPTLAKMPGWTKRILRVKKGEKTATTDPKEGSCDGILNFKNSSNNLIRPPSRRDKKSISFTYLKSSRKGVGWKDEWIKELRRFHTPKAPTIRPTSLTYTRSSQ